jgi:cytidine deaminase
MADTASGALSDDEVNDLLRVAHAAAVLAYSPYSKQQIGAALLSRDGEVFTGCNVENASLGLSLCAERAALVKAVSAGVQTFRAIAVASSQRAPAMPCGACRQSLREFGIDLRVYVQGKEGPRVESTLGELLPKAFSSADFA